MSRRPRSQSRAVSGRNSDPSRPSGVCIVGELRPTVGQACGRYKPGYIESYICKQELGRRSLKGALLVFSVPALSV